VLIVRGSDLQVLINGSAWRRAQAGERLVRAAGIEPARAFRPYGFSYHFGFRRRLLAFVVWTIPSP
jgi:hypothetical protein